MNDGPSDERVIFRCETLPFFTGVHGDPHPQPGIPATLPFELVVDSRGLVQQSTFLTIQESVSLAYERGLLLTTPPGPEGYGRARADELLDGLFEAVGSFSGLRVLEIGCGSGYVLGQLKKAGAECIGCEVGPWSRLVEERYGIRVLQAQFSEALFEPGSFDLVFSSMVLEHVKDPDSLLAQQVSLLRDRGILFAAVPECDLQLVSGDPSMPCHEHVHYFTRNSLYRAFLRAGCTDVEVREGRATLSLQCRGRRRQGRLPARAGAAPPTPVSAERYGMMLERRLQRLEERLKRLRGGRLGLCGISVGASVLSGLLDLSDIELSLFDNDPEKLGKLLVGVNSPIRPDDDIRTTKPHEIWIIPFAKAGAIRNKLVERHGFARERIVCVSEIDQGDATS